MYNSNLVQSQEKTLYEAHQKFIGYQNDLYQSGYADGVEEKQKEIDALTSEIAKLKEQLAKAGISAE